MGSKGGGGKSTTVYQNQLPEYAEPYFKSLMERAQQESRYKYAPYEGQRIARYTPEERQVQSGVRSLAAAGPRPELAFGAGQLGRASQTAASPGMWTQQAYQQYASPYFENVIDIQKREAARDAAIASRQHDASAVEAGAFGGYRDGIMSAARERNLMQQLGDIEATGRQGAWEQAQAMFERDRSARFKGADIQTQIAQQAQSLAQTQQSQSLERLTALEASGAGQRELQQQAMELAYSDWLEEQNWKKSQLNFMNAIMRGIPVELNKSVETPGPSFGSQIAGAGMTGLAALAYLNK
jgi:hypothetical protein